MKFALVILVLVAACTDEIDEPWELQHDRIIAIRATPPRILPGETSTIDLLLGYEQMPAVERAPDRTRVIAPASLANTLAPTSDGWAVTAPSEQQLALARAELGLMPDEPVPLQLGVTAIWPYKVPSLDGTTFTGVKTIWLGDSATNPELGDMLINGSEPGAEVVVPIGEKIPLSVAADDTVDIVTWLTSCGEMHDFDLHDAYLKVPPESSQQGQLAVIKRDNRGGVSWRIWPIRAGSP